MRYNFDEIITRKHTDCEKWDSLEELFGDEEALALWVADMDFPCAEPIITALKERANHPIFGYPKVPEALYDAVIGFYERQHHFAIQREWLATCGGIVHGINLAIQAFTKPGDKIIVHTPAYHPFFTAINNNDRELITSSLLEEQGHYYMDFDDLEAKLKDGAKAILFCSPQNPTGRVWLAKELQRLAELALDYDALIISDEIHGDIVHAGHHHLTLATIEPELAKNIITFIAPSKTFNIAGLATSFAVIPDLTRHSEFRRVLKQSGYSGPTVFGITAAIAAYSSCDDWLMQMKAYLQNNLEYLRFYINGMLNGVRLIEPEGTFLAWLDFRELGLEHTELKHKLIKQGKVALSDGCFFGQEGDGFMRLNFACPRTMLESGLAGIKKAIE